MKDGVVLDLRYEARDIDQNITSQAKIDQWFDAKTKGLTDLAKAQLKQRWGTLQKVLSSQSRLQKIVGDVLMDMSIRPRLMSGRGNAILVCASIFEACKLESGRKSGVCLQNQRRFHHGYPPHLKERPCFFEGVGSSK